MEAVACGLSDLSRLCPPLVSLTCCARGVTRLSLWFGVYGSLPVSLHYALSPMQFPVVVPVHWTPSAFLPFGSVLTLTSIHLTAGASLDDVCSCWWPGSLVLLVSLSFWPSGTPLWFSHCLSVSGVHRTVRPCLYRPTTPCLQSRLQ